MSDERRKDPEMRQRIEDLQAGFAAQQADLDEQARSIEADRKVLTKLGTKLTRLMWSGIAALVVAAFALTYLGFKLDDRGQEQGRLARENAALVEKLNGEIKRNQAQRQKSATNACLTRREQNETLVRAFVPPEFLARVSKKDRDILAGPDDCEAYGRSVTTDKVPAPKRGTKAKQEKK